MVPSVPGGGHVLIVPITHYPTYASIPTDLSEPILEETRKYVIFVFSFLLAHSCPRYEAALGAFYSAHNAQSVSFEVGRITAKGGHAHIQVIPIPRSLSTDAIANAFISEGSRLGIDLVYEDISPALHTSDRGYFKVSLPDGRHLIHWLRDGVPFGIQFGRYCILPQRAPSSFGDRTHTNRTSPARQVIVSLLGIPDRFDWKRCAQSEDEDRADVQAFKAAFSTFEPNL